MAVQTQMQSNGYERGTLFPGMDGPQKQAIPLVGHIVTDEDMGLLQVNAKGYILSVL